MFGRAVETAEYKRTTLFIKTLEQEWLKTTHMDKAFWVLQAD